ncbi:MAG: DUF222 domain-containing protein, partial [Sporichthyaceae bacterium]|nr:DUF222 domain-containing protein [Sporichthyaceae bacterium]
MSEVLDPPVTGPVSAAVGTLAGAVDELVRLSGAGPDVGRDIGPAGELWSLSSGELLEVTAQLHRAQCQADAVMHALVREADARGAAIEAGAVNTAGWLRGRLRMHPGTAKRLVETARGLHDDPAGPLVHHAAPGEEGVPPSGFAELRAVFAAGDISAEHAQVACRTLAEIANLPGGLDPEVTERAEAFLVEQATQHDPKALNHLGRHLRHILDPDQGDRLALAEEHATGTQHLELTDRRDGGVEVRGRLGPELGAALRAHLGPLSAPRPAVEGMRDLRSVGQRQADGLGELLRRYARSRA